MLRLYSLVCNHPKVEYRYMTVFCRAESLQRLILRRCILWFGITTRVDMKMVYSLVWNHYRGGYEDGIFFDVESLQGRI
jgi:hypothetical protein